MLLVAEIMPATSDSIPLIGKYVFTEVEETPVGLAVMIRPFAYSLIGGIHFYYESISSILSRKGQTEHRDSR